MPYLLVIIVVIMPYSSAVITPWRSISRARDIAARNREIRVLISASILSASSPIFGIAARRTELPVIVAVGLKLLSALLASKPVKSLFLDTCAVCRPPIHSALVTTKTSCRFSSGRLEYGPTHFTGAFILCQVFAREISPAACFYGVYGQTHNIGNLLVTIAPTTELHNQRALTICHSYHPFRVNSPSRNTDTKQAFVNGCFKNIFEIFTDKAP